MKAKTAVCALLLVSSSSLAQSLPSAEEMMEMRLEALTIFNTARAFTLPSSTSINSNSCQALRRSLIDTQAKQLNINIRISAYLRSSAFSGLDFASRNRQIANYTAHTNMSAALGTFEKAVSSFCISGNSQTTDMYLAIASLQSEVAGLYFDKAER